MASKTTERVNVPVPLPIKRSVDRLMLELKDMDDLACGGKPTDWPSLISALMQWFGRKTLAEARTFLEGEYPALARALRGKEAGPPDVVKETTRPARSQERKGGKTG